jgi:hypothetical protein
MEDVLEVYHRPRDPDRPVVCLDETTKQLIKETRVPIPARPGQPARHDYEYERNGVANLFMLFAPLEGWRHVEVTDRHAAVDYAKVLRDLSDRHFASASKIVLVQDNLSTHKPASLYEAFPASEARRLVERFEWHYTPKHGSWLDMAEIELSVLTGQCLDRRIPDQQDTGLQHLPDRRLALLDQGVKPLALVGAQPYDILLHSRLFRGHGLPPGLPEASIQRSSAKSMTGSTRENNLEHNFGHGQRHLASVLATLNLLAFATHTACDLADRARRAARRELVLRQGFFQTLLALTAYHVFQSWELLLQTMAFARPPPQAP